MGLRSIDPRPAGGPTQPEGVPLQGSVHPGLSTGYAQLEGLPLHDSVHPAPHSAHANTAVPRDGLLYDRLDQAATAYAIGLGALSAARAIGNEQAPWGPVGTLRSEGSASTSGFTRCSGIPARNRPTMLHLSPVGDPLQRRAIRPALVAQARAA